MQDADGQTGVTLYALSISSNGGGVGGGEGEEWGCINITNLSSAELTQRGKSLAPFRIVDFLKYFLPRKLGLTFHVNLKYESSALFSRKS